MHGHCMNQAFLELLFEGRLCFDFDRLIFVIAIQPARPFFW